MLILTMTLNEFINLIPEYQHMLGVEKECEYSYSFLVSEVEQRAHARVLPVQPYDSSVW